MRTVSEVAALAGVTVRTLHHYDQIGLLSPSARSAAGYRLYDHDDLRRLQQVMAWRELGFGLGEIAAALDDPDHDPRAALTDQRAAIAARRDGLTQVLKGIDAMLAELDGGPVAKEDEMFDGYDPATQAALEQEAEERWGDTDAWRRSRQRTAGWTDADRARVAAELDAFEVRLAAAFTGGVAATSAAAMDLAEEARLAISTQFYDCPHEMHVALGEMYVADPRFTAHYDRRAEGLAAWFRDAIVANAQR